MAVPAPDNVPDRVLSMNQESLRTYFKTMIDEGKLEKPRTDSGRPCTVMVLGTSGVGKTRLIATLYPLGSEQRKDALSKVSFGRAGVHEFGQAHHLGDVLVKDTPGLEHGKPIDAYLDELGTPLFSKDLLDTIDVVWRVFCDSYPGRRIQLDPVADIFSALSSARVPVLLVFTCSDALLRERDQAQDPSGGPQWERSNLQALTRSVNELQSRYPNIKKSVFVSTTVPPTAEPADNVVDELLNTQPVWFNTIQELLDLTQDYVSDGAAEALARTLAFGTEDKISLSTEAIMLAVRKRELAWVLANPVPMLETVVVPYMMKRTFKQLFKVWGLTSEEDQEWLSKNAINKALVKKVGVWGVAKASIWAAAYLVAAPLAALQLVDAPVIIQVRVRLGLMLTAVLARVSTLCGGRSDGPDVQAKMQQALQDYSDNWASKINDFCMADVSMFDAMDKDRRKILRKKIQDFLTTNLTLMAGSR